MSKIPTTQTLWFNSTAFAELLSISREHSIALNKLIASIVEEALSEPNVIKRAIERCKP